MWRLNQVELALRDITYLSVILRPLIALIIGGIIGLERGMKNRDRKSVV